MTTFSPELEHIAQMLAVRAGLVSAPEPAPVLNAADQPSEHKHLNWDRWLDLVDENQLGPFLGAGQNNGLVPVRIAVRLSARYTRQAQEAVSRVSELQRVLRLLDGVAEPVVLKGAALAPGLYDEAAQREMSDFDLWIADEARCQQAARALEMDGYRAEGTDKGHHHLPPLISPLRGRTIEIHRHLTTPALSHEAEAEIWGRRKTSTFGGFAVLDPIAALCHHAVHALADPVDSPLLRNLFEVAWLAARLSPVERSRARTLAESWGVADRLARALGMAAELFHCGPAVEIGLARPRPGALERWCHSRLEWTESREGDHGALWRFRRNLMIAHLQKNANIVGVALEELARGIFSPSEEAIPARPQNATAMRAPCPSAPIGDSIMVHDPRTGEVHLLRGPAAEVWLLLDGRDPGELSLVLEDHGVSTEETALALEAIEDLGLLVWGDPAVQRLPAAPQASLQQPAA